MMKGEYRNYMCVWVNKYVTVSDTPPPEQSSRGSKRERNKGKRSQGGQKPWNDDAEAAID